MAFRPVVHSHLTIGGEKYFFSEHPVAKGIPYGQTGRRATVYQARDSKDRLFALKVFTSAFRSNQIESNARLLQNYSNLPGMEVCSRKVITAQNEPGLIRQYPDLEYAVLMPWAKGQTWQETMLFNTLLPPTECLLLAKKLSYTLCTLEQNKIAHCDLSAPNLLISDGIMGSAADVLISLVDVEDLYAEGLVRPQRLPAGSAGYGHRTARQGMWSSTADRFAGAILLTEMLTWCDDRVLKSAYGEQYFAPDEMQVDCHRYRVLYEVMNELYGGEPADLFQKAWHSSSLDDCPTLFEWQSTLQEQRQATQPQTSITHTAHNSSSLTPQGVIKDPPFSVTQGSASKINQLQAPPTSVRTQPVHLLPWFIATIAIILIIVLSIQLSTLNGDLSSFRQGYYELSETVDIQSTQIADQAAQIADQVAQISDQEDKLTEQAAAVSDMEDLIESQKLEFTLLESMIPIYVGDRKLVYGPETGELIHNEDDYIEFFGSETLNKKDFIVRAGFQNPFSADEHSWDYGFLFRDTGGNEQYRLVIFSNQTWELSLHHEEADTTVINNGDLSVLKTDADATNDIVVVVQGSDGYLFVNGSFISWLDLSGKLSHGDVYIATGMYSDDELRGNVTGFYDFTVWSLP